ncbi:unnamed protein product [Caenorhabditis sp. 36 PRJEB53466]|nr:unnamed protein product [Caenorhabditis sp. 36 PRJEB53466]
MSDSEGEMTTRTDNMSTDEQPHDDFDFERIYSECKDTKIDMNMLLAKAKEFHHAHRHLISQFVIEPSMSIVKMNFIFAKYFICVLLNDRLETVINLDWCMRTQKALAKCLVKTMNKEKGRGGRRGCFRPWRFVISNDEKDLIDMVTMTGTIQNSSVISESNDMTKADRALLLLTLEEMIKNEGCVRLSWIQDQAMKDPCKMKGVECDAFISRMAKQKYLAMDSDSNLVEITPRIMVELEPWIRAKFVGQLKFCDLCRKIICRPIYTAECPKCQTLSHYNCFIDATNILGTHSIECNKCKTKNTLAEVREQVKKRESAPARRISTPRLTEPDNSDEEEEKDEEEDKKPEIAEIAPKTAKKSTRKRKSTRKVIAESSDDSDE